MKMKRCVCLLLVAIAMLSCLTVGISAAGISRASGSFNITIKAGRTGKSSTLLPLEAGEKVTIKASYTPFSARVDVGLMRMACFTTSRWKTAVLMRQSLFQAEETIRLLCATSLIRKFQ